MRPLVFFWVSLLLPLTYSFGQIRKIDIPVYATGDTSFYYKMLKNQMSKMGLQNLTTSKDSINFRFWSDYQMVDLVLDSEGKPKGSLYSFEMDRPDRMAPVDYLKVNYIFQKKEIQPDTALLILKDVLGKRIHSYPSESKLEGYQWGTDGHAFKTEFTSDTLYKFATYWSPSSQPQEIKEAHELVGLYSRLESLLGMRNNYEAFLKSQNRPRNSRYDYYFRVFKRANKKKKKNKEPNIQLDN